MMEAIPAIVTYNPNPGLRRRLAQGWKPFIYWDEGRWFVFARRVFDSEGVPAKLQPSPMPAEVTHA